MIWLWMNLAFGAPWLDTTVRGGVGVSGSAVEASGTDFVRGPDLWVDAPAGAELLGLWLVVVGDFPASAAVGDRVRLGGWLLRRAGSAVSAEDGRAVWALDQDLLAARPQDALAYEVRGAEAAWGVTGAGLVAVWSDPLGFGHRRVRLSLGGAACEGAWTGALGGAPARAFGPGQAWIGGVGPGEVSVDGVAMAALGPGFSVSPAAVSLPVPLSGAWRAAFAGCGQLAFVAASWALDSDGDGIPDADDRCTVVDADGDGFASGTQNRADCPASNLDCDDEDAAVSPGAVEIVGDGIDQDCDGDDGCDGDGDGYLAEACDGFDCDDTNAAVHPGQVEVRGDGVDQNCDGDDLCDEDGDGVPSIVCGGDDCNDNDPDIYPDADEIPGDGIDQNCDGLDACDLDGDGYNNLACGGTDCDDRDPSVHPGAEEIWYDSVDQDCDGNDFDQDGDGFSVSVDCDDTDASVFPTADDPDCSGSGGGDGCACASARPSGAAGALLVLTLAASRRRRRRAYAL